MTGETPSIDTLGWRLDDQARRIAARRLPDFPWARPLEVLFNHLTSLPTPFAERFARTELPRAGGELDFRPPRPDIRSSAENGVPGLSVIAAAPAGGRPRTSEEHERPRAVDMTTMFAAGGRPLPSDVRGRLDEVAGRGAGALRVHDDDAADAVARAHRADAVTVGPDVYFRQGKFRPREPHGFGLLVHEATHVLGLLQPGAAWRRATRGALQDEEETALVRERAVTRPIPDDGPGRTVTDHPAPPPVQPVSRAQPDLAIRSAPPASPALHPMTAVADRDLSVPSPVPVDLEALRRSLIPDLMRQLRAEFERGG